VAARRRQSRKIISGRAKISIAKNGVASVLSFFVTMEIMSAPFSRFYRIVALTFCLVLVQALVATAGQLALNNLARVSVGARVDDKIAEAALISGQTGVGYALLDGQTELVLSLSKIQNIDIVSFLNNGTKGTVTVATSNSKLATGSLQWRQIAKQNLNANVTKIELGPTEAKYVKFTFNVAKSGRIAELAVYSTAKLTMAAVDGKDAKDFGGGKEAKEVAEGPPEEGPPPNLPDPPPFVFVPLVSP
jgi:hypothetical protein